MAPDGTRENVNSDCSLVKICAAVKAILCSTMQFEETGMAAALFNQLDHTEHSSLASAMKIPLKDTTFFIAFNYNPYNPQKQ